MKSSSEPTYTTSGHFGQAHLGHTGRGLSAWCIDHPIGTVMIALAVVLLGAFALSALKIDLLPKLIYPEVRVRVLDPGVPAQVMEDKITRQLEEQLAITENAVSVQSSTSQGRSNVDLSFNYGTDIDAALRDASTRLDRARRFLPESVQQPVIYKRDPSQIPVMEYVIASPLRDPVALRSWVEREFSKWFLTVPGVASTEVGGGLEREIQILPDQYRMNALGIRFAQLKQALAQANVDTPTGRLNSDRLQISGRTVGRFDNLDQLRALPLNTGKGEILRLDEVAEVLDTHADEKLRIRTDGLPGVKLSIQKQPGANTVGVVDGIAAQVAWLKTQQLIPDDITVVKVADQAIYVRRALDNATLAAGSGALLAMFVVWLFLGNLRRTLIVSSAIPLAIMVTFMLMAWGGLTLNIMSLGGLALGVGMLVDNTIVMLENIARHQKLGDGGDDKDAARIAAAEVQSPIFAATSTNLAAVLPFLFVSGLVGLLFRELIFTISAAVMASLIVALTLVPTLAARVPFKEAGLFRRGMDRFIYLLQEGYGYLLKGVLKAPWLPILGFVVGLWFALPYLLADKQQFLPKLDEGRISISITADPGITLDEMDSAVQRIEAMVDAAPAVVSTFTTVGGFVFGRSEYESPNRSSIRVQLLSSSQRDFSDRQWVKKLNKQIKQAKLAGIKVRMRVRGIRGVRLSKGDDDLSLRLQGPDLAVLRRLADQAVNKLKDVKGISNLSHSAEEDSQELAIEIDRKRAADLNLSVEQVGRGIREALEGAVVSDYLDGDQSFDIRLRMPLSDLVDPQALTEVMLKTPDGTTVTLSDLTKIHLEPAPSKILRDRQARMVEISASLSGDLTLSEAARRATEALSNLDLPTGYLLYDGGAAEQLNRSRDLGQILLAIALFLVLVVMAVQYESIRNPLVILFSVPFAAIGVSLGLQAMELPLSMPVWLGLIMLAGIVVNNAIIVVEFIELERSKGTAMTDAIINGAKLRLRPVLMTTLTTVVGMLPLALTGPLALGDGTEMLQPLAVTIVYGLSFSMLVSLLLVPAMYRLITPLETTGN